MENARIDRAKLELEKMNRGRLGSERAWDEAYILKGRLRRKEEEMGIMSGRLIAYNIKESKVANGEAVVIEELGDDRFGIPIIRHTSNEHLPGEGR